MYYPWKYPEVYAELARQGLEKTVLANELGLTLAGLRYKQSLDTTGDFSGEEIAKTCKLLGKSANELFSLS